MTEYHGPYVADDDEARGLMSLVTGKDLPAERAPDYVAEIRAMEAAHPTLTYIPPQDPDGPHAAAWDEDDGAHQAARHELRNLVAYLRARLGAR